MKPAFFLKGAEAAVDFEGFGAHCGMNVFDFSFACLTESVNPLGTLS